MDLLIFGLRATDDTTGQAPASAIVLGKNLATGEIFALNGGASGNYSGTIEYSAARASGDWVVEVKSDVGTATALLPPFGTGPGTGPLPVVSNLSIVPGAEPAFTWSLPAGLPSANDGNVDRIRIRIRDSNRSQIFDDPFDTTLTATAYMTPSGVITHNGAYVGQVLIEGFTPFDRSRTFETFVVEDVGTGGQAVSFNNTSMFREIRTDNSVGWSPGDRISGGAEVDVFDETYMYMENGGEIVSSSQSREANRRFEFATGAVYDPNLSDDWTITAWNGVNETTAVVKGFGAVDPLPTVRNFRIEPDFQTPIIRWDLPVGNAVPFDNVQIGLFDDVTNDRLSVFGPGQDQLLETLDPSATSFTFAPGMLQQGGKYVSRIVLRDRDDIDFRILNRSLSFNNFTPIQDSGVGEIYLPIVEEGGVYSFDFDVIEAVPVQIDPLVAIGYDYDIGDGNPLFASVMLPFIGDGLFDLILFDDQGDPLAPIQLAADVEHFFTDLVPSGVDRFRILGIETTAGLEPADVTAFITTLTFVADGSFTGTMAPITVFVPDPDVPTAGVDVLNEKINLKRMGVMPVALLGSDTLDVAALDLIEVNFGPGAATPKHDLTDAVVRAEHTVDESGDGLDDLVFHFVVDQTGLTTSSMEACLTLVTQLGVIGGCDDVFVK